MEKLQLTKAEFIKELARQKSCLLLSRFGCEDIESMIETADEKLDETNVDYVNIENTCWREAVSTSNTKIVFTNDSQLLMDQIGEKEYYLYKGNYVIDYLVMINKDEETGIQYTWISGIKKA